MDIKDIASLSDLKEVAGRQERTFLLLYRGGTEKSYCVLKVLDELDENMGKDSVFIKADVNNVRDIHPEYGIESVPSLLEFGAGRLKNIFKGCNSKEFYISAINGSQYRASDGERIKQKTVTVYSTPACSWCNTLKSYLKERKVQFRDIDVSLNQKAAEKMVNKSGQQGVPQTEIDGQIIVGFDKKRIDSLLELGK